MFKEIILPGDIYIFCTDGLYEDLNDDDILKAVLDEPRESISKRLVDEAKKYGERQYHSNSRLM